MGKKENKQTPDNSRRIQHCATKVHGQVTKLDEPFFSATCGNLKDFLFLCHQSTSILQIMAYVYTSTDPHTYRTSLIPTVYKYIYIIIFFFSSGQ